MTIYQVYHNYHEDGGFGDAIRVSDLIASFANEEDARCYYETYHNPHIYDKPYADLWCGELEIKTIEICDSIDQAPKFTTENLDRYGSCCATDDEEYYDDDEEYDDEDFEEETEEDSGERS